MPKVSQKAIFMIYGLGAVTLSLHAWNYFIVQTLALKLVRTLHVQSGWQVLRDLSSALPLRIEQSSIFSGNSALLAGIFLFLVALSFLDYFFHDFQCSNSRIERLRLSAVFSFCYLMALMLASYLVMLAKVLLAGQAIKPLPKETIGALQYLDALSFLPWGVLFALMLFAFSEAALSGHSSKNANTPKRAPSNSDQESPHFMAAA